MKTITRRVKYLNVVYYKYISYGSFNTARHDTTPANWTLYGPLVYTNKSPNSCTQTMSAGSNFMLLEVCTAVFCVFSAIPSGKSMINTSYLAELHIFPQSSQFPHI